MSPDKIIVTTAGLAAIGFVYWFFLKKKPARIGYPPTSVKLGRVAGGSEEVAVSDSVEITVDGGYSPEVISLQKGKPVKLIFFRKDPSSCLEEVVLGDFNIRRHLLLNQKTTIKITPQKSGEFGYSCGMGMFHGKIIVK